MKRSLIVTDEQQADIDRLHVLLEALGVNTRNPKQPKVHSDSALFRWLVQDKLKQLAEAANAEGGKTK